jgi:PAS domain S-box-containing protein
LNSQDTKIMKGTGNFEQLSHEELVEQLNKANQELGDLKQKLTKVDEINPNTVIELLNLAPDAFFQGDQNGNFIFCNDQAEILTGYTRQELKSKHMSDLFGGEELSAKPLRFDLLEQGKNVVSERLLRQKDGKTVDVQMNSRKMPDGTYQSFIRDITERKRAEQKIRESEETYRNLFQNAQVGLFRTRISDGKVLESNDQLARICGYDNREEFLREYKTSENYVDEGAREQMIEFISKQGYVKNYEARYYKKDKSYFWASFSARIYPEKGWIEGVLEEITDRKAALEAMKISEEKFSKAFLNSPDVMIITAPDEGTILDVNDSIFRVAGFLPKDLKGKSTIELNLWEHAEQRNRYIQQLIKHGRVVNFESRFRKSNGEVFTGLISGEFIRVEKQRCVLSVIRDISERKKAEEQYRFLASILKHSSDFIGIATPDQKAVYVNPAGQAMLGLDGEEAVKNSRIEDFFFPEDLPFVRNTILPTLEKKGRWAGEFRFRHFKTGEPIQVLYDLFFTEDPATGKEYNISTISRNITELKIQEQKLLHAEKRFRSLIEHASDGVVIIDINGLFKYVSPSALRIFGYSEEETRGQAGSTFTHPDDLPKVLEAIEMMLQNPEYKPRISYRFRNKAGEYRWIETTFVNLLDHDAVEGLVLNFADITESRKAMVKLEESEANMKVILENSMNSIWAIDREYRIVYINDVFVQSFESVFGVHLSKGTSVLDSLPEQLRPIWKERYDKVLANNQFMITDKVENGTLDLYIEVSFKPILIQDKVVGASVYGRDITAKVNYEQELISAKNKAEENERLKSVFLQNMSHEIRTPMNGILGFLDLLKEPDLSDEQKDKYIAIVEKSGQRLLRTINDIIEISRIESGQIEVKQEEMNLEEFMLYLRDFFSRNASEKGIKLILEEYVSGSNARIVTDRNKLESILTNLINNAVKFTSKGSITIGNRLRNGSIEFWVKDTGMGIPLDRQHAIFDRFVQADLNITRPHEGSGLGLAITKAYAEMLGGGITLESVSGEGSAFCVTIPCHTSELPTEKSAEKQPFVSGKHPNPLILLAEDDQTSIVVLEWMLVSENFRVVKATTGREAVDSFRSIPEISLILMDLKMPDMNGFEATSEIRKTDPDIPVIAQTAYAQAGDKQKAIEAGCTDYIAKPIRKTDLIRMINKYLNINQIQ